MKIRKCERNKEKEDKNSFEPDGIKGGFFMITICKGHCNLTSSFIGTRNNCLLNAVQKVFQRGVHQREKEEKDTGLLTAYCMNFQSHFQLDNLDLHAH